MNAATNKCLLHSFPILGIFGSTLSWTGLMLYLIEQPFLYTLQVSDGNILDKSGTEKWIYWTIQLMLQIGIYLKSNEKIGKYMYKQGWQGVSLGDLHWSTCKRLLGNYWVLLNLFCCSIIEATFNTCAYTV